MSDEAKKLTAEELKAWDQYVMCAFGAITRSVRTIAGSEPSVANVTTIAIETADRLLAARRERGQQ